MYKIKLIGRITLFITHNTSVDVVNSFIYFQYGRFNFFALQEMLLWLNIFFNFF